MPPQAAYDLSIPKILCMLSEKLNLAFARMQGIRPPPVVSAVLLETNIESLETRAHGVPRFTRSFRNPPQPVNRLPPEIISHIARCLLGGHAVDARSIVPLTHVCRYWRDSIISTPDIWALISDEWEGLAALSLERSKAAPLEIWLGLGMGNIADLHFSDLLIPYIQNTKTLRVGFRSPIEGLAQTLPGFPQSMPNLRSLSLTWQGNPFKDRSIDPFGPLTPTLECLALYNVPLYPLFLHLRALTTFILNDYQFDLHPDTLLDFLEENKSLESVELGVKPTDLSLWSLRPRTAIKNRLQNLLIRCHAYVSARFLLCNIPLQRGADLAIID